MSDFRILKGDSSRIGTETTPFHDGHVYFTPNDGGLYIDSQDGDSQNRVHINPKDASSYTYDNSTSGLAADTVQDAIDEVTEGVNEATSQPYTTTLYAANWTGSDDTGYSYNYTNVNLTCGKDGQTPIIVSYTSNKEEYSKIESGEATAGQGIVFQSSEKPQNDIGIVIIDIK